MCAVRIVLVTADRSPYATRVADIILQRRRQDVIGVVLSDRELRPPGSLPRDAIYALRFLGFRGWAAYGLARARRLACARLSHALRLRGLHSTRAVAERYGVPCFPCRSINDPEFLEFLSRELAPDLIVSAFNPQIFKRQILALPSLGCINLHPSLLPKHRGPVPTFWVLAGDEPETGATVHWMDEKIDHGPIILQSRMPVRPKDSPNSLLGRGVGPGAALILEAIHRIEAGTVATTLNDGAEASYQSFPTIEDARLLRARGRALP